MHISNPRLQYPVTEIWPSMSLFLSQGILRPCLCCGPLTTVVPFLQIIVTLLLSPRSILSGSGNKHLPLNYILLCRQQPVAHKSRIIVAYFSQPAPHDIAREDTAACGDLPLPLTYNRRPNERALVFKRESRDKNKTTDRHVVRPY